MGLYMLSHQSDHDFTVKVLDKCTATNEVSCAFILKCLKDYTIFDIFRMFKH